MLAMAVARYGEVHLRVHDGGSRGADESERIWLESVVGYMWLAVLEGWPDVFAVVFKGLSQWLVVSAESGTFSGYAESLPRFCTLRARHHAA